MASSDNVIMVQVFMSGTAAEDKEGAYGHDASVGLVHY